MKNKLLLAMALLLFALPVSCTQGNLGTDVGNPLPEESDVLLPVKRVKHVNYCFVFDLDPELTWEEISSTEINVSDGDSEVLLDFEDVKNEYVSFVIAGTDAMKISDEDVLMKYAGAGFDWDESWDFPTAVKDSGVDREIAHINPYARMAVMISGKKSLVAGMDVSLDEKSDECSSFSPSLPDDNEEKRSGSVDVMIPDFGMILVEPEEGSIDPDEGTIHRAEDDIRIFKLNDDLRMRLKN